VYYNENMYIIQNLKCNYLKNYNDSEHAVKTKNAPFFINFPNINKMATFFPLDWSFNNFTNFSLNGKENPIRSILSDAERYLPAKCDQKKYNCRGSCDLNNKSSACQISS
jgi:hypothetical protein